MSFLIKSKPIAVNSQHIGLLILDALGIDNDLSSVEIEFKYDNHANDYTFTVITNKYCDFNSYTATYRYRIENMVKLGLDILKALDIDSTGVTGFKICCPSLEYTSIATVEITKNIVPDDDQLKLVLSNLKQEDDWQQEDPNQNQKQ